MHAGSETPPKATHLFLCGDDSRDSYIQLSRRPISCQESHKGCRLGEGGIIMHLELFDVRYANLASVEANQPEHRRCAVFLA